MSYRVLTAVTTEDDLRDIVQTITDYRNIDDADVEITHDDDSITITIDNATIDDNGDIVAVEQEWDVNVRVVLFQTITVSARSEAEAKAKVEPGEEYYKEATEWGHQWEQEDFTVEAERA